MSINEVLRQMLLVDAEVSAKCAGRVRNPRLRQNEAMPAVSFTSLSEFRGKHAQGADGTCIDVFQVDFWAGESDIATAIAMKSSVRKALHGIRKEVNANGVKAIKLIKVYGPGDTGFDEPSRLSRQMLELEIHYTEQGENDE
jgi:hypothetical protein